MKNLLLTSLLALSTTAAFAEDLPEVVSVELTMCDVLVSYYTGVPIEIVEDEDKAWLSYGYELKGKYSLSKSYVYSEYGFNYRDGATCEATFRGKEVADKADYHISMDKNLTDSTRDVIEYYVTLDYTDDNLTTFESKYINAEHSKDTSDSAALIEYLDEMLTEEEE